MRKIIVITGQTGTGKTSLALQLAKEKRGELINADARQVYRYLDIITGKDGIKIALYDVVDPKEPFSSFDYKNLALDAINNTISRNKLPIVVGGSYLYIKHLLYGFETEGIPANWDLRHKLNDKTVQELAKILQSTNVQSFKQMNKSDRKNPRRLIRRIEIAKSKTSEVSELFHTEGASTNPHRGWKIIDFIGLRFKTKEKLVTTIQKRVEERLEAGAIEEVVNLLKKGYARLDPGLNTIGYKQIIEHLEGRISKEEAIKKWVTAEVQYAKRQYTFMKRDANITWRDV